MEAISTAPQDLESSVKNIISNYDSNPDREGLVETPKRYLKFLKEFTSPEDFNYTTFSNENNDALIVQKDIPFYSLCEHHLVPFYGKASVGYLAKDKIIGLSKLARCVDYYARRFQNQERIGVQVAERLMKELDCLGVCVVIEAEHLCMAMRGIKKPGAKTITSVMTGEFKKSIALRQEVMSLLK